jgi:hypothetical protein
MTQRKWTIPRWLRFFVAIVSVLGVVGVISDALGLFDRFKASSEPNIEVEGDRNVIIGEVAEGDVEFTFVDTDAHMDGEVYSVEIVGDEYDHVVAYNISRNPLWQRKFGSRIREANVHDLTLDGKPEVIIATSFGGSSPGRIYVFDNQGIEIAEFNTWQPSIYFGASKEESAVVAIEFADVTNNGTDELVVIARDSYWYASRLMILAFEENRLQELADYWHPGHLYLLYVHDLNNDGNEEIICTARNNDLKQVLPISGDAPALFVLESSDVRGQAPPWFGSSRPGSELWYSYVTPSDYHFEAVLFEDINGDGIIDLHATLADGCSFYIDISGTILTRGIGSACQMESELFFYTEH